MIYELREYRAAEGRAAEMHARFADHTLALFERHGMTVAGFWSDESDEGRIFYLLSFADKESRDQAWAAFGADPEWRSVKAKSEENGAIVAEMHGTILAKPAYWPHETVKESA